MNRTFKFALGAWIRQENVLGEDGATEKDMAAINQHALVPLTKEQVAVFRMNLCNDQIDRHISRFPVEELKAISEKLIVGKPLMELHDMPSDGLFSSNRGSQPVGTFFRSQMVKEDGQVSVRPDVFMRRDAGDDDLIKKIESGIAKGTSISFALDRPECSACGCDIRDCAHMLGEEIDDEICHVVLKEVTDVFEGSIVPLGSQGTEFVEARGADGEPVLPLRDAIKQARGASDQFKGIIGKDFGKNMIRKLAENNGIDLSEQELEEQQEAFIKRMAEDGHEIDYGLETHPGDETDDELRTSIDEEQERMHEYTRDYYFSAQK